MSETCCCRCYRAKTFSARLSPSLTVRLRVGWQVGSIPYDHAQTDELFESRIREWFDPFGKIEDLKLRRKSREAGEYKSYCLVTYSKPPA